MQIPSRSSELEAVKEPRHAGGVPLLEFQVLSKLSTNLTKCLIYKQNKHLNTVTKRYHLLIECPECETFSNNKTRN